MSATEILNANDCSFARVDEEEPGRLLPSARAFPTAGDAPGARVPDAALPPDARNYTSKFINRDETATTYLNAAGTVLIATDMDAPGQRLADALAKCIGYAMCRGVSRAEGRKDANAVFGKLGAQAVGDALDEARVYPLPTSPPPGRRSIRMLPPSRGRRPSAELSPVEASHAR